MNNKIKSHCNGCLKKTNHEILYQEKNSWGDELSSDFDIWGEDNYLLVKCCGCENISLRHESRCSDDIDEKTGEPIVTVKYYPPAISRKLPKWIFDLWTLNTEGNFIKSMLSEIYTALQSGSRRLTCMGIRALLEYIMIKKVGDEGSFAGNLELFQQSGYVSSKQKQILETVFEAGHATMHRAYNPSNIQLGLIMDITEVVIETIYIHVEEGKKLKQSIPTRKPKRITKQAANKK